MLDSCRVYRMDHQEDDVRLQLDVMVPKKVVTQANTKIDIGEDFARSPHKERRSFLKALHGAYKQSTCNHQIEAVLSKESYYQKINQQGYYLHQLMLKYDSKSAGYQYCLFLKQT